MWRRRGCVYAIHPRFFQPRTVMGSATCAGSPTAVEVAPERVVDPGGRDPPRWELASVLP